MKANDLFKAVMELDLDPIKTKLMHVQSGEGWSLDKANAVEKEYRRFLCLMKLFPQEDTAPLVDVDTFWHYHILDTMKYARDCEQVFGYFLHHYPYVGMDGTEEDAQFRLDSGDRMRALYEATFGDAYPGTEAVPANAAASAWCAGPRTETAWCAGPRIAALAQDGEGAVNGGVTAWCAGPRTETAWCAGPRIEQRAAAVDAVSGATAWCAGPRTETAWCAGPRIEQRAAAGHAVGGATAWCAGPRTETAWCAGPRTEAPADATQAVARASAEV